MALQYYLSKFIKLMHMLTISGVPVIIYVIIVKQWVIRIKLGDKGFPVSQKAQVGDKL